MARKDKLIKLLKEYREGKITDDEISKFITFFGEEQILNARDIIEKFLISKNPINRYNALSTLVFEFRIRDHYKISIKFLLKDEDDLNRGLGASCLGSIYRGTKNKDILNLLMGVFEDKNEDWVVRDSAYASILDVIGIPWKKQPPATKKLKKRDIDWNLISSLKKINKTKK